MKLDLELFADYHQFYIQDESVSGYIENVWSEEALKRLLDIEPGVIFIGTARNMDVPVSIEILEAKPDLYDKDSFDQINECSIEVSSGKIVIAGCTDYFPDAKRISLENGWYRVRISYKNLTKLSEDGLDGEDKYIIHMWREPSEQPLMVVKQKPN